MSENFQAAGRQRVPRGGGVIAARVAAGRALRRAADVNLFRMCPGVAELASLKTSTKTRSASGQPPIRGK